MTRHYVDHHRTPAHILTASQRREWSGIVDDPLVAAVRQHLFPVFYAHDSGARWLLSPALDALAAEPKVSRRLDPAVLADRLFDRW